MRQIEKFRGNVAANSPAGPKLEDPSQDQGKVGKRNAVGA